MKKIIRALTLISAALLFMAFFCETGKVSAATAGQVSVERIDYELLEMTVNKNGNSVVYFSTDNKKTYNEVEGAADDDRITMDISWASSTANVVIYLKGNSNQEVMKVTLPKQASSFKVTFDKIDNTFTYVGQDDREYFYYRKATDYNWQAVSFTDSVPAGVHGCISQAEFLASIPQYRFKGTKLVFRLGQVIGTSSDMVGERPGREVTVTIAKYLTAPQIKPNLTTLKFNTKTTMEYSTDMGESWNSCENNMTVAELAPAAELGSEVTLLVRTAATDKKPESLTRYLVIPGRGAAPVYGVDYTITLENGKVMLNILTASKENPIEYSVLKTGDFDESTARWTGTTIKKTVKYSATQCPDGAVIYVRFKGVAENTSKQIALKLPSKASSVNINLQ